MTATRKAKAPPAVTGLRDRAQTSRAAANRALQAGQLIESAALPPACGVSRIGERLAEAYAKYWELDALPILDKDTDVRLRMRDLEDVHKELQEAISYGRAGSAGGVLAQLSVTYDALNAIRSGSTETIQDSADARAERCLLSIAAALCAWTGVERTAFGAGEIMPARLDTLSVLAPEVA